MPSSLLPLESVQGNIFAVSTVPIQPIKIVIVWIISVKK